MLRLIFAAVLGLISALEAPVIAAPLEAYGRLQSIQQGALAPDGQHVAFILTDGEKRSVAVFRTSDRKLVDLLRAGNNRVRSIQWGGPNHLIITTSSTTIIPDLEGWKREWWVPQDVDIRTGKMRPIISGIDDVMNVVYGEPMIRVVKGKAKAFLEGESFVDHVGRTTLFSYDFESGITALVRQGRRHTYDWLVDADGNPLASTDYDADAKKWSLTVSDGAWHMTKALDAEIWHPDIVGLGRDGRSVLLTDSTEEKDGTTKQTLREIEPGAADWGEPFASAQNFSPSLDDSTGALIGIHQLVNDQDDYEFYDPTLQKYWNAVAKAYPGARVTLLSVSDDRKRFLVKVDSPIDGPSYAFVDIAQGTSDWLGGPYDSVLPDLAPTTAIGFKAADGLALTGYLTTPKGAEIKNLPLVVFPHGGPEDRDEPGFDWWAQAMASRGYAVLKVNFRGSGDLGWDFLSAGFGQLGRKMQTDLSDGVRYLAGQGKIDPKRVCIVGGSYGGYAALAGATIDTGVYRCAVSVAGISDWRRMVKWDLADSISSVERYWRRYIGAKSLNDPVVAAISPIDHIDKVTIPILLIHGADDTVVPFEQSQMMFDALQKAGKQVELVKLNHEDHHLLVGDTRLQMLQATMAFLRKNNPP